MQSNYEGEAKFETGFFSTKKNSLALQKLLFYWAIIFIKNKDTDNLCIFKKVCTRKHFVWFFFGFVLLVWDLDWSLNLKWFGWCGWLSINLPIFKIHKINASIKKNYLSFTSLAKWFCNLKKISILCNSQDNIRF